MNGGSWILEGRVEAESHVKLGDGDDVDAPGVAHLSTSSMLRPWPNRSLEDRPSSVDGPHHPNTRKLRV